MKLIIKDIKESFASPIPSSVVFITVDIHIKVIPSAQIDKSGAATAAPASSNIIERMLSELKKKLKLTWTTLLKMYMSR